MRRRLSSIGSLRCADLSLPLGTGALRPTNALRIIFCLTEPKTYMVHHGSNPKYGINISTVDKYIELVDYILYSSIG